MFRAPNASRKFDLEWVLSSSFGLEMKKCALCVDPSQKIFDINPISLICLRITQE